MRRLVLVLLLLAVGGAVGVFASILPRPRPKATVTDIDPKKLFRPRLGQAIDPDIAFLDERGRRVTMGEFGRDRPFILMPAYYRCPSLCNEVLNDLTKAVRGIAAYQVGKDFDVVIVSFDTRDEPEVAAAKKASYVRADMLSGDAAGWHFLTGEQGQIDRLLSAVGYKVIWDEKKEEFLHAAGVVVCSPGGTVARYFPGLDYRPLYLRLALAEAGQGKIAPNLMDQVLMPCFSFDATKGQYSAAVLRIVQVAGVLMLAGIGLLWLVLARRPRPAVPTEAVAGA